MWLHFHIELFLVKGRVQFLFLVTCHPYLSSFLKLFPSTNSCVPLHSAMKEKNVVQSNVLFLSSLSSGAVIGDGQSAVASNIANTTYRLQWWDFTKFDLPEISNGESV